MGFTIPVLKLLGLLFIPSFGIGYSLTSGHFSSPTAIEVVTGAPRYLDIGRIYILDLNQNSVVMELTGSPVCILKVMYFSLLFEGNHRGFISAH